MSTNILLNCFALLTLFLVNLSSGGPYYYIQSTPTFRAPSPYKLPEAPTTNYFANVPPTCLALNWRCPPWFKPLGTGQYGGYSYRPARVSPPVQRIPTITNVLNTIPVIPTYSYRPAAPTGSRIPTNVVNTIPIIPNRRYVYYIPAAVVQTKEAFRTAALQRTNYLRRKHCVAPLTEDATLTQAAQTYADKLANSESSLVHSPSSRRGAYGENLFRSFGIAVNGDTAVNTWYGENVYHDYNNPRLVQYGPGRNLHFTSIVWRDTSNVGFGVATSRRGKTYVVANYSPPGNYPNPLLYENVLRPSC